MVGREFAFNVALKHNMIKDLKIRCDYREEFEVGGTLEVDEIKTVESKILRVAGKFGVIDLDLPVSELKKIIEKDVFVKLLIHKLLFPRFLRAPTPSSF